MPSQKKLLIQFAASISVTILVGCIAPTVEKLEEFPAADGFIMLNAGYQPVVHNANGSICFGAQPDALMNIGANGAVSDFSLGETESEQVLGGRNPNVLIVRDLLFHSCLAESRFGLNKEESLELFKSTMELIGSINQSSLEASNARED